MHRGGNEVRMGGWVVEMGDVELPAVRYGSQVIYEAAKVLG